jgi:hypothetical protein
MEAMPRRAKLPRRYATQPYSATEVDGWNKLSRVSQNRAAVQHLPPIFGLYDANFWGFRQISFFFKVVPPDDAFHIQTEMAANDERRGETPRMSNDARRPRPSPSTIGRQLRRQRRLGDFSICVPCTSHERTATDFEGRGWPLSPTRTC